VAQNPRQFRPLHLLALIRIAGSFRTHELIAKAVELKRLSAGLSVMTAVLLGSIAAEALAVCDRILAIDPRDIDTLYNRAVVLSRLRV